MCHRCSPKKQKKKKKKKEKAKQKAEVRISIRKAHPVCCCLSFKLAFKILRVRLLFPEGVSLISAPPLFCNGGRNAKQTLLPPCRCSSLSLSGWIISCLLCLNPKDAEVAFLPLATKPGNGLFLRAFGPYFPPLGLSSVYHSEMFAFSNPVDPLLNTIKCNPELDLCIVFSVRNVSS